MMIVDPFRFGSGGGSGVTARYWRVFVIRNCSTDGTVTAVSADDIQMRATIGGADQCTDSSKGFANSVSGAGPIANGFNGTGNGSWISGNDDTFPYWVGYDFTTPVAVAEVAWAKRPDSPGQSEAPQFAVLQYSSDNSTWTNAFHFETAATWGSGAETRSFSGGTPWGGKRAWRIRATSVQGGTSFPFSTAEIQMRETIGGADACAGGVPISSQAFGGYGSQLAFDNVTSGGANFFLTARTVASGATLFIGYIFPSALTINEVTIQVRGDSFGANEGITGGVVESSADGVTWTSEWTFTSPATWANNSTEVRTFTRP